MQVVVLDDMETYISRRQNTYAQCIETQPIVYIFLDSEQSPGLWVPNRWWYQEGLYYSDMWEVGEREVEGCL